MMTQWAELNLTSPLIDIDSKEITGQIQVADRPMGLEISDDDEYVYVACHNGKHGSKGRTKNKENCCIWIL